MRLNRLALLPAAVLILASCASREGTDGHEGHDHEEHAASVTVWDGGLELFAGFHPPVSGEETVFTVHLTRLEDFRPVAAGTVQVVLRKDGTAAASATAERPVREGLWILDLESPEPGDYEAEVSYEGAGSVVFHAGIVTVYATEEEAVEAAEGAGRHDSGGEPHGRDAMEEAETVTFLKEQQWNTEFLVEEAGRVSLRSSVAAVAEVVPRQSGFTEVSSPVDGFLRISHNQDMAMPGRQVAKGERLVTICPPPEGTGSWIERRYTYDRAKKEFERAERLLAREAISQRDYDEIRKEWLVEKASFETVLQGATIETTTDSETGEVHLTLGSPLSGIVTSVGVMPGQTVSAGQRLMTVVDPSVVWLRADMFEKDYYRMGAPRGAQLTVPGMDEAIGIGEEGLKLMSGGGVFDRESMTIPVIFEIENARGMLKIGQTVQMEIYTSEEKTAVALPVRSLIDEDYSIYVFVQHGGESFEKRAVRTGARSGGLVEIVDGLEPGEKVVTRGAYAVKLASSRSETGAAHVH